MDWDERLEHRLQRKKYDWMGRYIFYRGGDAFLPWVSTFHPDRLSCEYAHANLWDEPCGSYKWNCQVIFTNGESWMVRFARGGMVSWADEKVENEVAVMRMVRQETDIPVPEIKAWGLSKDCPFGLGPFIMMPFVKGVSLDDILRDKTVKYRLLGEVDDRVLAKIYRQVCRFQLALARLSFPRIGSLSWDSETRQAAVDRRPLTWRVHEILQCGGIDLLCPVGTTFATTTEYFDHITEGDLAHLEQQPNSIDNREDAATRYRYWRASQQFTSAMTLSSLNHGPFKLICDDFTPANMIVDNADDLNIVAVLEWEWSYSGPAQFLWSSPTWLLLKSPTYMKFEKERVDKYAHCLDLYVKILGEEEASFGYDSATTDAPSALVKESRESGRSWYNQILQDSYNGPETIAYTELAAASEEFRALAASVPTVDVEQFVEMKMLQLAEYDAEMAVINAEKEAETGETRVVQADEALNEEEAAETAQQDEDSGAERGGKDMQAVNGGGDEGLEKHVADESPTPSASKHSEQSSGQKHVDGRHDKESHQASNAEASAAATGSSEGNADTSDDNHNDWQKDESTSEGRDVGEHDIRNELEAMRIEEKA